MCIAEQWETSNVDTDILDFSTVNWEGRTLDAILVKSLVRQKNAVLGKYDESRFTFGLVDDPEFNMRRGLFAIDCGNVGFVNSWEINKGFRSEWNVGP